MAAQKLDIKKTQLDATIRGLKAVAHPDRLKILLHLSRKEHSVGELVDALGISQSAASQHLSKMKEAGYLGSKKVSNQVFYSIKDQKFKAFAKSLLQIFSK